MVFEVSGVTLLPYIARGGLQWQRSDVDGPNAGRMMNGDMQRDRVATKIRWDVTCRPVTPAELSIILRAIEPEFVTVKYDDPVQNTTVTGTFYSNNFPVTFLGVTGSGERWNGLTFPLIQK